MFYRKISIIIVILAFVNNCGKGQKQKTAEEAKISPYRTLGIQHFVQGRYDKAVEDFKKVLSIAPDNAEAHKNLGLAYAHLNRITEAIGEYNKAIKIDPKLADAYNDLGVIYHVKLQDFPKALDRFKKAVQIDPQNLMYKYNLGALNVTLARYEEATEGFKKIIELDPKSPLGHYSLAVVYLRRGMYAEAEKEYKRCLEIGFDSKDVRYQFGLTYFKQNKLQEAVEQYRKALEIDPNYGSAHYGLANAYLRLGKTAQGNAEMAIFRQLGEKVGNVEIKYIFFANPDKTGEFSGSKLAYSGSENEPGKEGSMNKGPEGPSVQNSQQQAQSSDAAKHYQLAKSLIRQGQYDQAIGELEKTLKIEPGLVMAHGNLGDLYHRKGQYDRAVNEYQTVIKLASRSKAAAMAHGSLGTIYESKGNFDLAIKEYEIVVNMQPDLAAGPRSLARLYALKGVRLDKALELAQKSVNLSPDHASFAILAWVYFKMKMYPQAEEAIKRAIDLNRNEPSYGQLLNEIQKSKNK